MTAMRMRGLARGSAWRAGLVFLIALCGCGETIPDDTADTVPEGKDDTGEADAGSDDTDSETETEEEIAPPACLSVLDPTLAEGDAQDLFDYDHVPTFDIYLPPEEWEFLIDDAVLEQYTEAEVCFEGRRVGTTVGLRFKGSYGTLYGCFEGGELVCPRLSMKLKFSEYDEDQRFYGLKKLNFHANRYDDSRMRERLAYDTYREMGIVAPRAAWAVVRVNGESLGLYGMVEQIDGRFTADRWPDNGDANLYKEVWPPDSSGALMLGLRTNEEVGDVSGFEAFSEAIAAADESELLEVLGTYTDLDYWARYMAVDEAVLSYDGITYFWYSEGSHHNHNYYFYEDAPEHFTLIPWDVESTFWINPDHAAPHWTVLPEDCDETYPYWGGEAVAPGCDPVFRALNQDHTAWHAASRELLDGPFALDAMIERIDRYEAFIGDEARAPETPTMYTTFDNAVQTMRDVIPNLRSRLEAIISEE